MQMIYNGEGLEKQPHLLNSMLVSIEGYYLFCGGFYSPGHF